MIGWWRRWRNDRWRLRERACLECHRRGWWRDRYHEGPCLAPAPWMGLRGPHIFTDPSGGPGAVIDG